MISNNLVSAKILSHANKRLIVLAIISLETDTFILRPPDVLRPPLFLLPGEVFIIYPCPWVSKRCEAFLPTQ